MCPFWRSWRRNILMKERGANNPMKISTIHSYLAHNEDRSERSESRYHAYESRG